MTHVKIPKLSVPSEDKTDIEAIAEVIRSDTLAFQSEDYAAWERVWAHDDRARDVFISTTAGISVLSGWPAIAAHMKKVFDNHLSERLTDFGYENLQISVVGDCAWAVFDTWTVWENGERGESFDTRVLERHGDEWKIVYASFVLRHYKGPEGLALCLDRNGQILQASPASLDALKSHPFLTVSHGRIRAHRLDWDKALQKALEQAAQHHGFFETYRFAHSIGGTAQYPVVLGTTDEGGVAVVRFSIRDNFTYLWIDADQFLDRHMKFARAVFSLSEGQIKVARQIALGSSVRSTAEELGVSVNTARTHLTRLYEKTGVRSQAALVRLLLSVG